MVLPGSGTAVQEQRGCWESSDTLGTAAQKYQCCSEGAVPCGSLPQAETWQKVRLPWRRRFCCQDISVECRPLRPEGAPCVPRRWSDCPPSSLPLHTVAKRALSACAWSLGCRSSPQCCHTETETILLTWRPQSHPTPPECILMVWKVTWGFQFPTTAWTHDWLNPTGWLQFCSQLPRQTLTQRVAICSRRGPVHSNTEC